MTAIYRPEYPRPQFVRDLWMNLNGEWEFEFDDADAGYREKWYLDHDFTRKIRVPFCYQSKLSGIGDTSFHDIVWYRRFFELPGTYGGKRVILHFGAVDYLSHVWVNGQLVAMHRGGHTPFSADITDVLQPGQNTIVVRAQDDSVDVTLPRGKQYWKEKSESIFYTRTTGIWQTVWLEGVHPVYLRRVKMTPDIDKNEIQIRYFVEGLPSRAGKRTPERDLQLRTKISFEGEPVAEQTFRVQNTEQNLSIGLHDIRSHENVRLWHPDHPHLYDVEFTLIESGQEVDRVKSYFGMRKIEVRDGEVCLNNRPFAMKLVLDQGYFPDGIMTPPSDEAIRRDVELTKAMGFNGARKHQKIEDPRYHYWCDKLGLVVWGEMANAYGYSEDYVARFIPEWIEAVERDYNHPCIVAWVPLNESWGIPRVSQDPKQASHAKSMYYLTKSLDSTRLVMSNDGWEHTISDLCTLHDYDWRREALSERYSSAENAIKGRPHGRWIYVGTEHRGEPILVTEFGGISFKRSEWEGWGYSGAVDEKDFVERLVNVFQPIIQSPVVQGFCYTQLTDVEQEINGLLTYDRQPKLPLEVIRQIVNGEKPEWNP